MGFDTPKMPSASSIAGAAGAGLSNILGKEEKDGLSTLFKVVIPGVCDMVFKSCEGMESEIEVNFVHEGGSLNPPRTTRGVQRVSKLSFGKGSGGQNAGKNLFDWYQDVCDSSKPLAKKSLSIYVNDGEGNDISEWKVVNAWPCRWVAPMLTKDFTAVAVEYITFAHEGITRTR